MNKDFITILLAELMSVEPLDGNTGNGFLSYCALPNLAFHTLFGILYIKFVMSFMVLKLNAITFAPSLPSFMMLCISLYCVLCPSNLSFQSLTFRLMSLTLTLLYLLFYSHQP